MTKERAGSLWNPDLAPTGPGAADLGLVSFCLAVDRDDRRGAGMDAGGGLVEQGMSAARPR
jgi:hypothetical protein